MIQSEGSSSYAVPIADVEMSKGGDEKGDLAGGSRAMPWMLQRL